MTMLIFVSLSSALLGAGLTQYWLRDRYLVHSTNPLASDVLAAIDHYIADMDMFAQQVVLTWIRHIDAACLQMAKAMTDLSQHLAVISTNLQTLLETLQTSLQYQSDNLFQLVNYKVVHSIKNLKASITESEGLCQQMQVMQQSLNELKHIVNEDVLVREKVLALEAVLQTSLTSALRHTDQQSAIIMTEIEAMQRLMENLSGVYTDLHQSHQFLSTVEQNIQQEIDQSLVALQFQDRIGQVLSHVHDNMHEFLIRIRTSHSQGINYLKPVGAEELLCALQSSYTMIEENQLHQGQEAEHQPSTDITFF